MSDKSVVLLSGGLDSAVAAALECEAGREVYALTVYYHQTHDAELAAARAIAEHLGVREHRLTALDIGSLARSPLTGAGDIPTRTLKELREPGMSPAYVPNRNMLLAALGVAWAVSLKAERVVLACNKDDGLGFPDCRPGWFGAMSTAAAWSTSMQMPRGWIGSDREPTTEFPPVVSGPLTEMSKVDVAREAVRLGVPIVATLSCYQPMSRDGEAVHCGRCDACVLRREGMAGIDDPTVYVVDF